jgi:hypothetical protein
MTNEVRKNKSGMNGNGWRGACACDGLWAGNMGWAVGWWMRRGVAAGGFKEIYENPNSKLFQL